MKNLRVIILGDAPAHRVERTRASVPWAESVQVRPAASRVEPGPWTLVLYPGETLAADAPARLEQQLATTADHAVRLRILTTLCGSSCVSDFFAPGPEVRLLRAPAHWPGTKSDQGPLLEGLWIYRDLGDSPDAAATALPMEVRAEAALATALDAWHQRESRPCSTAERRALSLYAWRLLVEADRADGEKLSAIITLPVVSQTRI